jgi:hypothetical protein
MPSLKTLFFTAERVLAERVTRAVDTPVVANTLLDLGKLGAAGLRRADDLRDGLVHLLALPSSRDIARLSAQVMVLRRDLAEVEAQLDDRQPEA